LLLLGLALALQVGIVRQLSRLLLDLALQFLTNTHFYRCSLIDWAAFCRRSFTSALASSFCARISSRNAFISAVARSCCASPSCCSRSLPTITPTSSLPSPRPLSATPRNLLTSTVPICISPPRLDLYSRYPVS